jgi:hypothetical protein
MPKNCSVIQNTLLALPTFHVSAAAWGRETPQMSRYRIRRCIHSKSFFISRFEYNWVSTTYSILHIDK